MKLLRLTLFLLLGCLLISPASAAERPPNVILVFIDDK